MFFRSQIIACGNRVALFPGFRAFIVCWTNYFVLQATNAQRPGNKARNRVGIYVFKGIIVVTGVCMMGGHNMCRVGIICGVQPKTGKGVVITGFMFMLYYS